MTILQLKPPIPINTPRGPGLAHFINDESIESDIIWTVFIDETGECWSYRNREVRAQKNITAGRLLETNTTQTVVSNEVWEDIRKDHSELNSRMVDIEYLVNHWQGSKEEQINFLNREMKNMANKLSSLEDSIDAQSESILEIEIDTADLNETLRKQQEKINEQNSTRCKKTQCESYGYEAGQKAGREAGKGACKA